MSRFDTANRSGSARLDCRQNGRILSVLTAETWPAGAPLCYRVLCCSCTRSPFSGRQFALSDLRTPELVPVIGKCVESFKDGLVFPLGRSRPSAARFDHVDSAISACAGRRAHLVANTTLASPGNRHSRSEDRCVWERSGFTIDCKCSAPDRFGTAGHGSTNPT